MKEFFVSALPLIAAGIALAILAVIHTHRDKTRKSHIAVGAGIGLLLGTALNGCGLWHSHLPGLVLGPLWGMVLGSLYQDKITPEHDGDCEEEH